MEIRLTVEKLEAAIIKTGLGISTGLWMSYDNDSGCALGIDYCNDIGIPSENTDRRFGPGGDTFLPASGQTLSNILNMISQNSRMSRWARYKYGIDYISSFIEHFDDRIRSHDPGSSPEFLALPERAHKCIFPQPKRYYEGKEDGLACRKFALDNEVIKIEEPKEKELCYQE